MEAQMKILTLHQMKVLYNKKCRGNKKGGTCLIHNRTLVLKSLFDLHWFDHYVAWKMLDSDNFSGFSKFLQSKRQLLFEIINLIYKNRALPSLHGGSLKRVLGTFPETFSNIDFQVINSPSGNYQKVWLCLLRCWHLQRVGHCWHKMLVAESCD